MKPKIVFPDYNNNIIGISNSIMKYYGAKTYHQGLPLLDTVLSDSYKNIVFMIYDGMGSSMMRDNLPGDSYLINKTITEITSVFPPTTVAACTSYYSGKSPFEHGWLGWALYFSEYDKQIEVFTDKDFFTREPVAGTDIANIAMPFKSIYSQIDNATKGKVKVYSLYPEHIARPSTPEMVIGYLSFEDMLAKTTDMCKEAGKKFILAYHNQPDSISHKTGCKSQETKTILMDIDKLTEFYCNDLKDTLIIISADHGHIDVNKDIFLNEIPELDACLLRPPSIEPRAASIFVKPGMEDLFARLFDKHLGEDFLLFSKQRIIDMGLFGPGQGHLRFNGFIGNFVAAAVGSTLLRYQVPGGLEPVKFMSHHAGLTADEMYVPLIIIKS